MGGHNSSGTSTSSKRGITKQRSGVSTSRAGLVQSGAPEKSEVGDAGVNWGILDGDVLHGNVDASGRTGVSEENVKGIMGFGKPTRGAPKNTNTDTTAKEGNQSIGVPANEEVAMGAAAAEEAEPVSKQVEDVKPVSKFMSDKDELSGGIFASPNRGSDTIDSAKLRLGAKEQDVFKDVSARVDKLIGLNGDTKDALGAWRDGAENTTFTEYDNISMDQLKAAAAMRGLLGEQKAVIFFKPNERGKARLHEITVSGDPKQLNEDLLAAGVEFHTIVPAGGDKHRIMVFEDKPDSKLMPRLWHISKLLGGGGVSTIYGDGEFLGDNGTEKIRPTRYAGRKQYEKIVNEYLENNPDKEAAWSKLHHLWKYGRNLESVSTGEQMRLNKEAKAAKEPLPYMSITPKTPGGVNIGGKSIPTIHTGESVGNRFHQINDGETFHYAINAAKNDGLQTDKDKGTFGTSKSTQHGAFVYSYSPEEYKEMEQLVLDGGAGGMAVKKNGDVVSVFKNPTTDKKNIVDTLMPEAIALGGDHLDCFDGYLPGTYAKYGFKPVAKIKFNREYAPPDWNYERDGEPDLVYMIHDGRSVDKIKQDIIREEADKQLRESNARGRKEQMRKAVEAVPYVNEPDDAVAIQKQEIERIEKQNA